MLFIFNIFKICVPDLDNISSWSVLLTIWYRQILPVPVSEWRKSAVGSIKVQNKEVHRHWTIMKLIIMYAIREWQTNDVIFKFFLWLMTNFGFADPTKNFNSGVTEMNSIRSYDQLTSEISPNDFSWVKPFVLIKQCLAVFIS